MICQIPPLNRRGHCQIPAPHIRVKYHPQIGVDKANQNSPLPVNTFIFPRRRLDIMKYGQILHNTLQYIKCLDIFIGLPIPCLEGVFDKSVVWGWYLTEDFTRVTLMKTRSLASSAFQFRLAATGPEKRPALFQCVIRP